MSEQKQADNLVGAYEYATTNYPWLGGMFIFNLNFNVAPWITDQCEQMRYYAIANRPAEVALTVMPKSAGAGVGELVAVPGTVTAVYTPTQQPIADTISVTLKNSGTAPLVYTMTLQTTSPLTLTVSVPLTGTLDIEAETAVPLGYALNGQALGAYTGTLKIETASNGVATSHAVPVTVHLWDVVYNTFVPMMTRP